MNDLLEDNVPRTTSDSTLALPIFALLTLTSCGNNFGFPGVYRIDVEQGNVVTDEMVEQLRSAAQVAIAARAPELVRILPGLHIEPLPYWLCSHRELRHSAKVRRVYDFLAERLAALPLG